MNSGVSNDKGVPARPPGSYCSSIWVAPWIRPLLVKIANGDDRGEVGEREAKSLIGFTSEGDLLFYRRISSRDRNEHPMLEGVDEVWIALEMAKGE